MASTQTAPQPTQPAPAAASAAAKIANAGSKQQSGSLYVGDLASDVTEALLFELFNQVGPVSSIRVCRDASSRMSLGYAYVNYHNVQDAERALDTLNFTTIKNKPCRIMWSHRDPSIRKNNQANIFIKNLAKDIDHKALYDTFSAFGNILSCKVAMEGNESKGYAFVHYETEDAAQKAIEKVNGKLLHDKKVYVGLFEKRSERTSGAAAAYTNVYVKNVPADWTEEKLRTEFQKFGTITSLSLPVDAEGKHKGFGFVNYDSHEDAVKAKEGAGDIATEDETKKLFVDRFQKKAERAAMLSKKYEEQRREKSERFKNLNLYVKNLEDDVDDEKLKELFQPFGEIASAVVMTDEKKVSKGFGFVCFAKPEDATKALNELNGKLIGSKPLYVNRAQRKEDRRVMLESQFAANLGGRMPAGMAPVFYGPPGAMPPAAMPMMYPGMPMQAAAGRRFPQAAMRGYAMQFPGQQPGMRKGGMGRGRGGARAMKGQPRGPMMPRQMPQPIPAPMMVAAPQQPPPQPGQGELTASVLASASPEMQKQMLGERLFPLIQAQQPALAAKITGMLLEMETAEILTLLESQSELSAKIQEAIEVLNANSTEA